ncbi:MAG: hypothetical protein QOH92_571 [Chloroflexota bacterium]|jgi:hypothetical protein|nr:hypothetical protein [Chloroflexota bacterium]
MPDPIAIGLSAVSLAASVWLTFETQLRRARMRITILRAPVNWSVNLQRRGNVPGVPFLANLEDAEQIKLSGSCPSLIGNDGPKGGAVWDAHAVVTGLGDPWELQGEILKPQPYTLGGKTYAGLDLWFALTCPIAALRDAIPGLDGSGPDDVRLQIVYKRHGWFGRVLTDQSEVSVGRAALLEAFKRSAAEKGVDLARVKLDPWIRERIEDGFREFGLSFDERNNLRKAVWMATGPQQMVLTYPIDGDDGKAVLYFAQGWTGISIAADGKRSTLGEIAKLHDGLVVAVRERLYAHAAALTPAP